MVQVCARGDIDDAIFIRLGKCPVPIGKIIFERIIITFDEPVVRIGAEDLALPVKGLPADIALLEKLV